MADRFRRTLLTSIDLSYDPSSKRNYVVVWTVHRENLKLRLKGLMQISYAQSRLFYSYDLRKNGWSPLQCSGCCDYPFEIVTSNESRNLWWIYGTGRYRCDSLIVRNSNEETKERKKNVSRKCRVKMFVEVKLFIMVAYWTSLDLLITTPRL